MTSMGVRVITDSSAGIEPTLAARWGVGVVPLLVEWEGQTLHDGVQTLPVNFYERLVQSDGNPKTSAPAPGDFLKLCMAAVDQGATGILVLTVSAKISSGTVNSARIAARQLGEQRVRILDTKQAAGGLALTAVHAARIARAGAGLVETLRAAEEATRSIEMYLALDTLKYLQRSGRISLPKALLGEWFGIKPVLSVQEGELRLCARTRTMDDAISFMFDRLTRAGRSAADVLLMYADDPRHVERLTSRLPPDLLGASIVQSPVSAAIGANAGPGLVGIAVRFERYDGLGRSFHIRV